MSLRLILTQRGGLSDLEISDYYYIYILVTRDRAPV